MPVAGAVEVQGGGPGRIRPIALMDHAAKTLHAVIRDTIAPGATVKTDGGAGYPGAPGVNHEPHVVGPMAAHVVLPWVHRVFANLKTWALGVDHGLRRPHLQADLDEFTFRFNRRRTRHAAFRTLLGIGLALKPATYQMLIAPEARA
jgi:ISXO2-like transposase domain